MTRILPATLVMLAVAAAAAAQTPAPAAAPTVSTPPIRSLLSAGDHVSITTADGVIHQGRVLSLSNASIELVLAQSKQKTTIPFDHLRRVEVRFHDRLTDGLKWGAVAGAVSGAIIGTVSVTSECHNRTVDPCAAGEVFGALGIASGVTAGIGAALGTVVDALHVSEREVWRAPRPVTIAFAPIATPRRAGVRFTMRW
jgi:hypothetical protein